MDPNKVMLQFKCTNLDNEDGLFGKSDAQLIVSMVNPDGSKTQLGETEVKMNNDDPVFHTKIAAHYKAGTVQKLDIRVIDIDGGGQSEGIGNATVELEKVLTGPNEGVSAPVIGLGKERGRLYVSSDRKAITTTSYTIDTKAEDVKDIEWFSKSDPYMTFYRPADQFLKEASEDTVKDWVEFHKTEFVKDSTEPDFRPFTITKERMCKNVESAPLKVEIYDESKEGKDELLSTGYFNLYQLLGGSRKIKTKDADGEDSAKIKLQNFEAKTEAKLVSRH